MLTLLWLVLGALGGTVFLALGRRSPQEDRFLALGLGGAALIYVAFVTMGYAPPPWLAIETAGVGIYGLIAWLGLCQSSWWLMLGWLVHPLWDVGLHLSGRGANFAPEWYAISCISFDLVVATYILVRELTVNRGAISTTSSPTDPHP